MPDIKIDSNLTGLRYCEEATLKTLPGSPVWHVMEPNSYSDFGSDTKTVARNPIKADRQRQKGVVTDQDASAGFEVDLTLDNMYDQLQGFFFADWRKKDTDVPTAVTAPSYTVTAPAGSDWRAGDLVFGKGFTLIANNGTKLVTASTASTVVAAGLAVEGAPPAGATIHRVGYQFAAGDAAIATINGLPTLTTTTKNLTELGIIPGEWVFVGGDGATEQFATAACNGFARVRSVSANAMAFDKTAGAMVPDTGAAKTIRLYVGDLLKNESDPAKIKRRSYQLERSLGSAGYEYLLGAVPNDLTLNLKQADKITISLTYVAATSEEQLTAKAGGRPDLEVSAIGFNTTNDFSRLRLDKTDNTGLASYLMDATVSIKNGVTPVKALGVLGSIDTSTGDFNVSGSVNAYFNDIAAVAAVRNNADISLDFALVTRNTGMLMDIPLITLGGGRLNVTKDKPIELPLTTEAAAHSIYNHTMSVTYFAYLPTLAG